MINMDDSIPHPFGIATRPFDLPAWKTILGHLAAFALAVLFISAGTWKILEPLRWRTMVEQLLVPYTISLPLTLALGVTEAFAGVAILVPRFRRWAAWLTGFLLLVFMVYIGMHYNALLGKDCSCFPWVKRTIGPGFFVGDALMLVAAVVAGIWAPPSASFRSAMVILGAVVVFSGVSFGAAQARLTGTKAPDQIIANGQPFSLQHGKVFIYFYNPVCMHCDEAARRMAKLNWGDTKIIAVPTVFPQYAASFLHDTGLKAETSLELGKLEKVFPFKTDPPYGVAIEDGREKGAVAQYDGTEPAATLRKLGFIQ
jgi:uncharacterized membrane protein YphA (DoxX/SURF4 family)